jgi:hypothetical protein
MKILKRGSKSTQRFKVIKNNFFLGGNHQPEIGEILEFIGPDNLSTAFGLVQRGKLIPCDLPTVGEYVVISPFYLPGEKEKFHAASGDVVQLKDIDALPLMLRRIVVPRNKEQWCPYRLRERRKVKDIFEDPQFNGKAKISNDWKIRK